MKVTEINPPKAREFNLALSEQELVLLTKSVGKAPATYVGQLSSVPLYEKLNDYIIANGVRSDRA